MKPPGGISDVPRPMEDIPRDAAQHLILFQLAGVLRLAGLALRAAGSAEAVLERFPFLAGYLDQIATRGLDGATLEAAQDRWDAGIRAFARDAPDTLPLRRLQRATGLADEALVLIATCGLPDEDTRFGGMLEALQGAPGLRRVTPALVPELLSPGTSSGALLGRLRALGLLDWSDDAPSRAERALVPPAEIWPALRGEPPEGEALAFQPAETAQSLEALLIPDEARVAVDRALPLLASGGVQALLVRGVPFNGRRTVLAAVARALGLGVLDLPMPGLGGEARWRQAGAIATLLGAMPRLLAAPATGAAVQIPPAPALIHPLGVALGGQGHIALSGDAQALTVTLPLPHAALRSALWARGLGGETAEAGPRMARGRILRAAALARTLAGDKPATPAILREATSALDRQALDGLARRMPPLPDMEDLRALAVPELTEAELRGLAARWRFVEPLAKIFGTGAPGVRALFRGPSGTGKTLGARLVAAEVGLDLYRAEMASLVDKYVGETEKNLERLFDAAESLGVALLLDEGDALMAGRTNVGSAQDRWANLETSFLLQRLEAFEGLVIITTNAAERIDGAFQRRMDVVIDFPLPEAAERARILALHLPKDHEVPPELVAELAARCTLAGGTLRNVVLHASLLAMEAGRPIRAAELQAAVIREYRKQGAIAPLRRREMP